jgi:hypothetical protein
MSTGAEIINGHDRKNSANVRPFPIDRDSGEPPRLGMIYPDDIELKPRKWIIGGVLPRHGVGCMFGPSGCGKSFVAVDMGLRIATGEGELFGRPVKQGGVIYVAAEDAEGVQFRVSAWMKFHDADPCVPFAIIPNAVNLWADGVDAPPDSQRLIDAVNEETAVMRERGAEPVLIIIDTARDTTPGMEENSSSEMSKFGATLRRLAKETGAFVLTIAHVAKQGDGEDPRGSSALIGAVDLAFGLKADPDPAEGGVNREMWVRKQRNAPDAKGDRRLRWSYQLQGVNLDVMGEDGEPERGAVVIIGDALPATRKQKPLKPGALIVQRAIVALFAEGKKTLPAPRGIEGLKPDILVVRLADARDRARSAGLSEADSKDPLEASRKAFTRAVSELVAAKQLFKAEDFLWLPHR